MNCNSTLPNKLAFGQRSQVGLLERLRPKDGLLRIDIDECLVGDELGTLTEYSKSFKSLAFFIQDWTMEFTRWPVEDAVDLYRLEVLCVIREPIRLSSWSRSVG